MAEEEGFKITDRRGRLREEAEGPLEAEPGPLPGRGPAPAPPTGERQRPSAAAPGPQTEGSDLSGLFVMFASSALINLGEAEDPMTGERAVDLERAREAIDLLILLRDKTRGNRTEQESRLLEEILYDLQMRFVRAAGGGRPA
ncbi:MAG TPA: DUF1844 domain-containing protein [Methylomirabilota bacterium]|nr:DUF1844 domain-containing protein [Methylomirabilota bacterium]